MRTMMTVEDLQSIVGLLDNEQGVVYLSLFDTDLYDLLSEYIPTVDWRIYFDFANRIVIEKYAKMVSMSKLDVLKKAVYYALKGEEYNLKTLINTTKLEYDPLENYELHETIVNTSSISANMKYGELKDIAQINKKPFDVVTTTSYSKEKINIEKSMPERQEHTTTTFSEENETVTNTSTDTTGSQTNMRTDSIEYAQLEKTTTGSDTIGERVSNTDTEHKVSAYNTTNYQPSSTDNTTTTANSATDSSSKNETTNQHTDVHDITDRLGEKIDKKEESNNIVRQSHNNDVIKRINEITDVDTHVYDPHNTSQNQKYGEQQTDSTSTVLEHENENKQKEDGNRQRDLHGRYGSNTVQTMIASERELANLNITDKIIDIVLRTICEGVLYLW